MYIERNNLMINKSVFDLEGTHLKSQNNNQFLYWLNEISQIIGGVNNIVNEQQNKPQNDKVIENKENNMWKLYIALSVILILALCIIWYISKK